MSLTKNIKKIQNLLLDIKIDLKNYQDDSVLHKIDDVIDLVGKLKNNTSTTNIESGYRKFPGLVG